MLVFLPYNENFRVISHLALISLIGHFQIADREFSNGISGAADYSMEVAPPNEREMFNVSFFCIVNRGLTEGLWQLVLYIVRDKSCQTLVQNVNKPTSNHKCEKITQHLNKN